MKHPPDANLNWLYQDTFDQANFYLDLEGHLEQPGVKKALEELGFHTETLDILGVYEASPFRQK